MLANLGTMRHGSPSTSRAESSLRLRFDAAGRIAVYGGKASREVAEQLKLDELGGRDAPGILNMVNPISRRT